MSLVNRLSCINTGATKRFSFYTAAGEIIPGTNRVTMTLQRTTIIRVAKWLIAVLVLVGLIWASRSALQQWQLQKLSVEEAVAGLEESIQAEPDPAKRSALVKRKDKLQSATPSLKNLRWGRILIAACLYAIGIFIPGLVLHHALRSLGESPRKRTSVAAQLLGHAGKYVPGKAMVIVLRAGALGNDNVSAKRATVAVFMETFLMMAVGATLACAVICWLPVPNWMMWAAGAMAILASLPTLPPILSRVTAIVSKVEPSNLDAPATQTQAAAQFFAYGWIFSLASWVFIGAAFSVLVTAIPHFELTAVGSVPQNATDYFTEPTTMQLCAVSTAAIGLAMVVGFASLLPGGAGVRELVLTTILATAVGMSHALIAAIAARLLFIFVEAVCAALAWWWLRQNAKIELAEEASFT